MLRCIENTNHSISVEYHPCVLLDMNIVFINLFLQVHKFVQGLITNIKARFQNKKISFVNQAGHYSDKVNINRGCRQGDPLFLYLYFMC